MQLQKRQPLGLCASFRSRASVPIRSEQNAEGYSWYRSRLLTLSPYAVKFYVFKYVSQLGMPDGKIFELSVFRRRQRRRDCYLYVELYDCVMHGKIFYTFDAEGGDWPRITSCYQCALGKKH